jgi:membrane protein implicated in regulation of membrane protease activity
MVRVGLPMMIAAAGVAVLAVASSSTTNGLAATLIGVAALVVLANVLARLSISSQRDREREQRVRRRFTRTGHWSS